MNHWWVNQNQTYNHEVKGGYLWSPKTKATGRRNRFYDTMTETAVGDVVFSFCDTYIKAIGIVTGPCQSSPKPIEFRNTGEYWSREGWYVPVNFVELDDPVRPKDFIDVLRPTLLEKYSPIQGNGNGNQGVYLASVPNEMAAVLRSQLNGLVEAVQRSSVTEIDTAGDAEQERIADDQNIPITERAQLIKSRVGQGLFRSRVQEIEPGCRITGIADPRFLRASHIKPWAVSTDVEKLDGSNGLMLAPHIDLLFDKGFISFSDAGELLVSSQLPSAICAAWGIRRKLPCEPLSLFQAVYMAYHRSKVFRA